MSDIKSTMRTTAKAILILEDDGRVFIETENGKYMFKDVFSKFDKELCDIAVSFKEEEE